MRAFVIVMLGTTAVPEYGEFDRLIADGAGVAAARVRVVDVVAGDALPAPGAPAAVVLTGSAGMVTERAAWSERTAAWLPDVVAAGTPLLGICYGHQLLAHALGGRVDVNPNRREMGSTTVALHPEAHADPLFGDLPSPLDVQVSHEQSVLVPPPQARVLAGNAHDPYQALAVGRRAWSTQFHPEFDATVMRGYVRVRADLLRAEGHDPEALAAATRESRESARLLRRFAALAGCDS
jgi:GMP synthase (glutamine-hydrolysing)